MDWCDMFFHAVEPSTQTIVPVDDILKVIDSHYDFLKVVTISSFFKRKML